MTKTLTPSADYEFINHFRVGEDNNTKQKYSKVVKYADRLYILFTPGSPPHLSRMDEYREMAVNVSKLVTHIFIPRTQII